MSNFFTSIDDRYLLLFLSAALLAAYIVTRDKDLSNMAMLVLGAAITVLKDRAEKTLVVASSPEQTKAMLTDLLSKNN